MVIPAHAFWTWVCWAHVPLQEPMWILIGALFTAGPLTGTTWMAYHMFRVVYLHEQEKKRAAGR